MFWKDLADIKKDISNTWAVVESGPWNCYDSC